MKHASPSCTCCATILTSTLLSRTITDEQRCIWCGIKEMDQKCIKHGADRLAQDEDGATPLPLAARAGDLVSLKVLVESPGDVMIEDARGCNLLLYAARSGFEDVVQFLADMCADSSIHLSAHHLGATRCITASMMRKTLFKGQPVTYRPLCDHPSSGQ
jgi:hypothetical protein